MVHPLENKNPRETIKEHTHFCKTVVLTLYQAKKKFWKIFKGLCKKNFNPVSSFPFDFLKPQLLAYKNLKRVKYDLKFRLFFQND